MVRPIRQLIALLCLSVLLSMLPPAYAMPASYTTTGVSAASGLIPLPGSCGRGLPAGASVPVCCMFGYVFIDGQAVAGARVTITSAHDSIEVWTEYGPDSLEPYYRTSLSDQPLNAQPGETITIEVTYSSHAHTRTHTVLGGSQQVDAVLPRTQTNDLVFDRFIWQRGDPGTILYPHDVTVDSVGNIYVTDTGNARIQVFNRDHQSLYAWGTRGDAHGEFSSNPTAVAVSKEGNVYIADTSNHRIQQFTSNGVFVRSWGSRGYLEGQFNSPRWVAVDDNGFVYVTDMYNHRVQKFSSIGVFILSWGNEGGNNGDFNTPEGISVDYKGNIYVADTYNHRIQKFDSNGVWLASWGEQGNSDGQFERPHDVETDSSGNVYVSDSWNHRIQKFSSTGVHLVTWGSRGSNNGQFIEPHGISIDSNGNVNVADYDNNRIQTFTANGTWLSSWAIGQIADTRFLYTTGIAFDRQHNIFVVDTFADRVQKFSSTGGHLATWGEYGHGDRQFASPRGIALDSSDNIYVADMGNHRVQKLASDGTWIDGWGELGNEPGQFFNPIGIAVDSNGTPIETDDTVYVVDTSNHRIQQFTTEGAYLRQWGGPGTGNGQFESPHAIAIDSDGYIYILDKGNHRVQKFTRNGVYLMQWGAFGTNNRQFDAPEGIGVDSSNNIFVADTKNYRIQKFTSSGTWLGTWGMEGAGKGQFDIPNAIAVDDSGAVFVSEGDQQRLQILRPMTDDQPIATIISAEPRIVTQGQQVVLHGAGAVDAPNTVVAYEWLLDSATTPFATTPSATLATGTLARRRHTLTFRIRDSANRTSAQSIDIDIVPAEPQPQQPWTFLLYLAGDNGLATYFSLTDTLGALYRLKYSSANSNVTVVALVDGDRSHGGDSVRYIFYPDGRLTQEAMDEVNMGDPQTLIDFVRWGQRIAPADHYYLALADHANALDGIAWDYTSDLGEYLTNSEVRQALVSITENGAHPLDVLHLDGCLMGLLETAYQVRGQARYLISSENLVWSAFAYEAYRAAVGPTTDARTLATAIVDRYAQRVEGEQRPYTIGVLDLQQVDAITRVTNTFASELHRFARATPANRTTLTTLRDQVQTFDANGDLRITSTDDYVDLADWAALVQEHVGDGAIQQAAGGVQQALDVLVVHERHANGVYREHPMAFDRAHGVAIYYPSRPSARVYQNYVRGGLTFPLDTLWDEYLGAGLSAQLFAVVAPQPHPFPPLPLGRVPRIYLSMIRR